MFIIHLYYRVEKTLNERTKIVNIYFDIVHQTKMDKRSKYQLPMILVIPIILVVIS